jgi:hypothetical protein
LSYVFYEYILATGKQEYRDFCRQYRQNTQIALSRLPLLLPASVEAIAALTFGVRRPARQLCLSRANIVRI